MSIKNDKPTLVLGCSRRKKEVRNRAIDLYEGSMYQQLHSRMKSAGINDPLDHFNVIILSAEHGFVCGDDHLDYYDKEMHTVNDVGRTERFIRKHRKTGEVFNGHSKDQPIFVFLTNKYLNIFDQFVNRSYIQGNLATKEYICRGHRGILQQKSRFSRCIDLLLSKNNKSITTFRSGFSSPADIAFLDAKNAIGTSLAHCNSNKQVTLRKRVLQEAHSQKVFWDNGLITMINKKKVIDTNFVFDEFEMLIEDAYRMNHSTPDNISIVIPDDPFNSSKALTILTKHKDQINALIPRCNVILPVHKYEDVEKFIERAMDILDWPKGLCLGVPCLNKTNLNLEMQLSQIELALEFKDTYGEQVFRKVHFLGMSDATANKKKDPRLQLAKMYVNTIYMDACRVTAVFGKGRKGDQLQRKIEVEHLKKSVIESKKFIECTYEDDSQPIMEQFYGLMQEEDIKAWYQVFNDIMENKPHYQLNYDDESTPEEMLEVAEGYVQNNFLDRMLFEEIKMKDWKSFIFRNCEVSRLKAKESRYKAIVEMFTEKESMAA